MLAGIVAGAVIGFVAGVLKATRGVHEVITTIMLNYIAAGVTWWLVTGPLQAESSKTSGIPQTELIPEEARVGAAAGAATVDAAEEAVLNALWAAEDTSGRDGRIVRALPRDDVVDLLTTHRRLGR